MKRRPTRSGTVGRLRHGSGGLVEQAHLTHEVRLRDRVHRLQPEALLPDGQDVEASVGVGPGATDGGGGPDGSHLAAGLPDLTALAQEHDAEWLTALDAAVDHEAVALLEDVQRQGHARTEHRTEREQRDLVHRSDGRTESERRALTGPPSPCVWPSAAQWPQAPGAPANSSVRKLLPQPQPETALGLLTVKPAPMSVST